MYGTIGVKGQMSHTTLHFQEHLNHFSLDIPELTEATRSRKNSAGQTVAKCRRPMKHQKTVLSYWHKKSRMPPCHQTVNLTHMALQSNLLQTTAQLMSGQQYLSVPWHLEKGEENTHMLEWENRNNSVNQLCRFNLVSGLNQMHGIK